MRRSKLELYGARRLGTWAMTSGLAAALSLGPVPRALAAEPASVASPGTGADVAQAKAKYQRAVEAYESARFADAVRLFLEADAIAPSAALSYNIARAYEKLEDDAQTLRWYRNYLRLSPSATNAAEVRGYVRSLSQALAKKGIQQVTLLSTPAGATVAIDGSLLGVTPLTTELRPGKHSALLTRRGFADATTEFTLTAATPVDLTIELQEAPISSATTPKEVGRRFGIAPWITLGAAAACLGGAAAFEISRSSAQKSAEKERVQVDYERDFDAMNSRQTTARVLLGVGGVLAVAGTTLLVLNTRVGAESRVTVSSAPGGASLSWERRF